MNNFILTTPSSELRRAGREKLAGKWQMAILSVLFFMLLTSVAEQVPYAGSVWFIVAAGPLTFGIYGVFLAISRYVETKPTNILKGFNFYGKALGLFWYQALFIFMWSLLFIVPGIIASIRYSQAYYILLDDPSKTVKQCVDESKAMMSGNCSKYFCMILSFFGWMLLAGLAASIPQSIMISLGLGDPDAFMIATQSMNIYEIQEYMFKLLEPDIGIYSFISAVITSLAIAPVFAYILSTTSDFYNRLRAGIMHYEKNF